jgi:hypothetical protein
MPTTGRLIAVLIVFAVGAVLTWTVVPAGPERSARIPDDDALYALPGWVASSPAVTLGQTDEDTRAVVRRVLTADAGMQATLDLWTNPQPQAKMLFRKGPDRDFLGAGYVTESLAASFGPVPGGGALIARQGSETWLLVYTFGERRGRLGDGPVAWGLAEWDALLDQPNDYFLVRIALPFDALRSPPPVQAARQLSETLFPRLAAWYAQPG